MSECTICELNRISLKGDSQDNEASQGAAANNKNDIGNKPSANQDNKSKHIVIAITGFMQEDQDKDDFWSNLIGYYKHAELFAVSWNASTPTNFLQAGTVKMQ